MLPKLEKYEILEEIGHGGMAVVYRARDTALDRDVALKLMHPHLRGMRESRSRFEREAKAVARLRHPNILEIYDFSGPASEDSYIVTELIKGPTLKAFLDRSARLPSELVAALGIPICRALAVAHGQGIVHRDVKPENIMIHDRSVLKLTDFGIAQMVDTQSMTATGQLLGSPAHMAPEQIDGSPIDARTDVFSLGTVLYFAATGRLPFEGRSPHHVLKKIADGDYPDPTRIAPGIGGRFAGILRKALEKDPALRYATVDALREDLEAFVAETGLDPKKLLDELLGDTEAARASVERHLVATLPARGVSARKRGDLPGAMDHFNRVLAIDERNEVVLRLVRGIESDETRRRRVLAVGAVAVGALALGLAAWGIASMRSSPEATTSVTRPRAPRASRATTPGERTTTPRPVVAARAPSTAVEPPVGRPPAILVSDDSPPAAPSTSVAAVGGAAATGDDPDVAARAANGVRVDRPGAGEDPARRGTEERTVVFLPNPRNASIFVDGRLAGVYGPGFSRMQLAPGPHEFRFVGAADCCFDAAWRQVIPPGPGETTVGRTLRPRPARLIVEANVPSDVVVDGRVRGRARTLLEVPMRPGEPSRRVEIRATAPGYRQGTTSVLLLANQIATARIELEVDASRTDGPRRPPGDPAADSPPPRLPGVPEPDDAPPAPPPSGSTTRRIPLTRASG
ncbi:MAG: protein kinase [Deltaproteobacteria bacterium]|nr:protein kinase [Deltaproteobacteria bacterium]